MSLVKSVDFLRLTRAKSLKKMKEYSLSLEPDHAVALTMNFPQYSPSPPVADLPVDFDYQCVDCMGDLFGPIMAPYSILQEQCEDYRDRLERITQRRFEMIKKDFSPVKKKKHRVMIVKLISSVDLIISLLETIQIRCETGMTSLFSSVIEEEKINLVLSINNENDTTFNNGDQSIDVNHCTCIDMFNWIFYLYQ